MYRVYYEDDAAIYIFLLIRCGRVSGIKPILVILNFCHELLHHITISHDKTRSTVGVNNLSCLEYTEQSTFVNEIVAHRNLTVLTWVTV